MNNEMYLYTDKELAFLASHNDPKFFIPIIDRYGFKLIQLFKLSNNPEKLAAATLEKSFLYINCYNTKTEFEKWLNSRACELLNNNQNFYGGVDSLEELRDKIESKSIKPIPKIYFTAKQFIFSFTLGILFATLYVFLLKIISGNFSAIFPVLFLALAGIVAKLVSKAKKLHNYGMAYILKLAGIFSAIATIIFSYVEL